MLDASPYYQLSLFLTMSIKILCFEVERIGTKLMIDMHPSASHSQLQYTTNDQM